jgi:hypothetical protein
MAKVKAPLFSLDASGAIADTVVASKWRGRNYFRILVHPAQPRTDPQVGVRASFTGLVALIKGESDTVKAEWEEAGSATNITWLNMFVSVNQKNMSEGKGVQQHPIAEPEEYPPSPPTLSITGAKGRAIVSISITGDPTPYYAFLLHIQSTSPVTPSWSNLKWLGRAQQSITFELPMKPGTYYAVARASTPNAVLTDPSTQVTFTVT